MKKHLNLSVIVGLLAFCLSSYAQNPPVIPGSAESIGLTRIVPDTLLWFSVSKNFPQLNGYDTNNVADQAGNGSSAEATAGVLGDSTFLLAGATSATNNSADQSHTLVLQPADGRPARLDNLWHDDSGKIWLSSVNNRRQTGNPARVGGDPRFGAVNYGGAGEISIWAYPEFNSDGRFNATTPLWEAIGTVGAVSTYCAQLYQLNPITLATTPLMKAVDNNVGRFTSQVPPNLTGDFGRDGSIPLGLADGNFVVVGEDRSGFGNPGGPNAGRSPHAVIYQPNGTIVKEWDVPSTNAAGAFAGGSMWNNVGAFRWGFAVKPEGGIIYVYNNAGDLQRTIDVNATAGVYFDLGRSDGTRLASDIRSHYIFMAGKSGEAGPITNIVLCAWDANNGAWITNFMVTPGDATQSTDLGGTPYLDRCNLACDAFNRVAVTWRYKADTVVFAQQQCAARVMAFDGTSFTALTPLFFPFMQHDSDTNYQAGFMNQEPSVAMTPRAIMFYAKGLWNATGNLTNIPVTQANSHCYTVVSHPAPIAPPQPQMTITYGSPNSTVSWLADAGLFVLQSSPAVAGPTVNWTDVSPQPAITRTDYVDPTDKYHMSVPNGTSPKFYRLIRRW